MPNALLQPQRRLQHLRKRQHQPKSQLHQRGSRLSVLRGAGSALEAGSQAQQARQACLHLGPGLLRGGGGGGGGQHRVFHLTGADPETMIAEYLADHQKNEYRFEWIAAYPWEAYHEYKGPRCLLRNKICSLEHSPTREEGVLELPAKDSN